MLINSNWFWHSTDASFQNKRIKWVRYLFGLSMTSSAWQKNRYPWIDISILPILFVNFDSVPSIHIAHHKKYFYNNMQTSHDCCKYLKTQGRWRYYKNQSLFKGMTITIVKKTATVAFSSYYIISNKTRKDKIGILEICKTFCAISETHCHDSLMIIIPFVFWSQPVLSFWHTVKEKMYYDCLPFSSHLLYIKCSLEI